MTSLFMMLLLAGCETGVKPGGSEAVSTVTAPKSIDQTHKVEAHPKTPEHLGRATAPLPPPMPLAEAGFIATVNRYCPVMQRMKLNATTMVEHTTQFENKVVGFCCDDCRDAWESMSDEERRARLKVVLEKP
jgi:hypothetical protein